ncbi:MAG: ATP-binding protein [Bacillota bacterium]|nr:ATP-binding protein [Bacillota bacterium]
MPYNSNWEYILDELKRLDTQLLISLLKNHNTEVPNQFYGMVLSPDEIISLLCEDGQQELDETKLTEELAALEDHISRKLKASASSGVDLILPKVSKLLNLSAFEERCIIVCLAPEINRKYEKIYGYLQNDLTAKSPSIDFIMQLLTSSEDKKLAVRQSFDFQAPMMKLLMETGKDIMDLRLPLISRHLKLDDWVVNYLLGFITLDARLEQVANIIHEFDSTENELLNGAEERVVQFVNAYRSDIGTNQKFIFYFYGPGGSGKKTHVMAACKGLGYPLISIDAEKIAQAELPANEILRLLGRQVMLENSALCIENFDFLISEDAKQYDRLGMLLDTIINYSPLTFILGQNPWDPAHLMGQAVFVGVEFTVPSAGSRKNLWNKYGQIYQMTSDVNLDEFTEKFRFTPGQIQGALKFGESLAVWNSAGNSLVSPTELYSACKAQTNRKLAVLAPRIKANYSWDTLVLPNDQMAQMKEICSQVKYRSVVYEKWGFDRRLSLGKGLNVLFSGPPGCGKTMAAEVIANDLSLEIYKIDVSQIVSKYIGETEKNLSKIFAEAETSNAILFFDEADAMFGRRSEVRDAHDRYANIEISYLLQKMEEYSGVVILATNLNQNMDEAFLRRLHFNIQFPFPEKAQRKEIWKGIFPLNAPLDKDMDYDFMAEKFVLAGGNIKNIAVNAAFYAARDSCPIGMKQILTAAKREYKKLGKTFLRSDFDPYYQLIEVI